MKRSWIPGPLLAALGALSLGCGSACESAFDRVEKRYDECGLAPPDPGDPPGSQACSMNDEALLECTANCTESASCEGLSGANATEREDLIECYQDCAG